MKLIGRYIFKRMLGAFLLSLGGLGGTVWLSQALRELDLVTAKGQSFVTFFQVSSLIFPGLLLIVCPVAVLIGVIYTFNQLNADSELVIINASGASQATLLKPAATLGLLAMVVVAIMSIYLVPRSMQSFRTMLAGINTDLISSFIQEGAFMPIGDSLVFHIRDRRPDGTLEGIFIQDERDPDQSSVYIANRGTILKNPLGTFLVMQSGTIQQRSVSKGSMSIIEFESYAFDMSTFGAASQQPAFKPGERDTAYLLSPEPNDPEYQKRPDSFAAEFHDRLSSPLYALLFALLPVATMGQAQTTRQGRGVVMLVTVVVATLLRIGGLVLAGLSATEPWLFPVLYALPIISIVLVLGAILGGLRFSALDGISALIGDLFERRAQRRQARGQA
ncbi:LPS export ABC transporter permease LptF [Kaistia dalseonensis]|uniref:Lipopolysaccharide export system permease protein n=1 Tax=Kaistia dalseonensis TaxID=410840 RepID=A0ABU0H0G3_9HYPH|nr:LPS export ABC transporter permease LptF [Kaistia dalseonensis]MCX5493212.1 LPS export ABC transporter permease LptF [Kaistia dalseonensis]MDQ0435767.1 lipopolysaccharide export system permease protein [Kaistia dalseonensis]